jgi:hypothetical protein
VAVNAWWPDVSNREGAEKAIEYGFWAACIVAGITAIVALLALFFHKAILGIDGMGLVDAVLFAVVGFGINRKSRVAAILGLGFYVVERVYMLKHGGATSGGGFMSVILTLYFLHGVRGTFAYRKLNNQVVSQTPA